MLALPPRDGPAYTSAMRFLRRRLAASIPPVDDARSAVHCIEIVAESATGPRFDNQDRSLASAGSAETLWCAGVSDGAGGHTGGALAAQLTVDAVAGCLGPARGPEVADTGERAIRTANDAVRAARRSDPTVATMCATLTVALSGGCAGGSSRWWVAGVGDSPCWLVTPSGVRSILDVHTLAADLVRAGAISESEGRRHPGRHLITQAIGAEDEVRGTRAEIVLRPGDRLVVASDGIAVLTGDSVAAIVASVDAREGAEALIVAALAGGATDNVTAVVVAHLASCARDRIR